MAEGSNRRKRLLLVDDNKEFVTVLQEQLEVEGYEVVNAYDGETALRRVREDRSDLVLLDVIMPKLTGREGSRKLRRLGSRVPSIFAPDARDPRALSSIRTTPQAPRPIPCPGPIVASASSPDTELSDLR